MDINTGVLPIDHLGDVGTSPFVELSTQARLCRELLQRVPTNDFGLPIGIYRPDLLPQVEIQSPQVSTELLDDTELDELSDSDPYQDRDLFIGLEDALSDCDEEPQKVRDLVPKQRSLADQLSHSDIQVSYVPLTYDEGYPTLPHGSSLWGQFPFEPPNAYQAFQEYLRMAHESGLGVRMLGELPNFAVGKGMTLSMGDIHEYYHLFYWGVRSRAFDMFQLASMQKQQELRATVVVDKQYTIANKAMARLEEFLEDEEDFWDVMTPKTAVDLLKVAAGLQRTSVGLPATGPPQHRPGEDSRGSSVEFILRQFAQKSGGMQEGELLDESGDLLDGILNDPEAISVAQELILRMNKH